MYLHPEAAGAGESAEHRGREDGGHGDTHPPHTTAIPGVAARCPQPPTPSPAAPALPFASSGCGSTGVTGQEFPVVWGGKVTAAAFK